MASIALESHAQEHVPITAAMLSFVVVSTATSRYLEIAMFGNIVPCMRARV